jgi:hypothetical protein
VNRVNSSARSKWISLDYRVNGVELRRARLTPTPSNSAAYDVIIEHRLLGRFALHDEFVVELRDAREEMDGWREVSLETLKHTLEEAVERSKDQETGPDNSMIDELEDWEPDDASAAKHRFIPRIPVEGDTSHIGRAKRALALKGFRNRIVGGISSRGRIWGHVTFLVASPDKAQVDLLRAGFVQSPESEHVLVDSKNGWKVRLLAGIP